MQIRTHTCRINLIVCAVLFLFMIAGCKNSEQVADDFPQELEIDLPRPAEGKSHSPGADQPADEVEINIDSLIESMNLREKIGQLFHIPVSGTFHNERDQQYLEWKRLITQYGVGGLIFTGGDIYGQAAMIRNMQEHSALPLWISQEAITGTLAASGIAPAALPSGTTRFPPLLGIAATGNIQNAFQKGQITAREAKAMGVHQIHSPLLCLTCNTELLASRIQPFVERTRPADSGPQSPGQELFEQADTGAAELREQIFADFGMANSDLVTSMDEAFIRGVESEGLTVVADDGTVRGAAPETAQISPGEAAVRSLARGAIMIVSRDIKSAVYDVEKAVNRGRLSEERIDRAVREILQQKTDRGLFGSDAPDFDGLARNVKIPEYQAAADRIARESVTVAKNRRDILPLRESRYSRVAVISITDENSGAGERAFADEIKDYHSNAVFHVLDRRTGLEEKQEILNDAETADLLIIGSFSQIRADQPVNLTVGRYDFLRQLETLNKPSVLVAFGSPYILQELSHADVHLLAWSGSADQVRNTVPALFGGSRIGGKLPAEIPGMYESGTGIEIPHSGLRHDYPETVGLSTDSLMVLDEIMQTAIEDSVFPGGVVAVVRNGVIAWNQGYGYHDYEKQQPVRHDDIFDLASLTKVMATTTAVMKLHDEGLLDLDDPVAKFIPEYSEPEKEGITIRQLLLHTSRLPAFRTYVDELQTRREIVQAIRKEPLLTSPPGKYVYSDLGFILLGEIVEEAGGRRLDHYVRNHFYLPMSMHTTRFNPSGSDIGLNHRILPTEIDEVFHRGTVQGVAHDERAYYMDGIAGHAGLFASAGDLAAWAQMLLNRGHFAGVQYLMPETVDLFTGHQSPVNHRGYGFDRKSDEASSAGTLTGPRTFGHLGFTGTSIWMDPDANISIILLTNRSFPHRSYGRDIQLIRPKVADAVMRSITIE